MHDVIDLRPRPPRAYDQPSKFGDNSRNGRVLVVPADDLGSHIDIDQSRSRLRFGRGRRHLTLAGPDRHRTTLVLTSSPTSGEINIAVDQEGAVCNLPMAEQNDWLILDARGFRRFSVTGCGCCDHGSGAGDGGSVECVGGVDHPPEREPGTRECTIGGRVVSDCFGMLRGRVGDDRHVYGTLERDELATRFLREDS